VQALLPTLSGKFDQTNQLLLEGFSGTSQLISSGFIETNQKLTDLQLSNILDSVATVPLPDPSKALNWCLFMTNRRRLKQKGAPQEYLWLIPRLEAWSKSSSSSLIAVRGGFQSRLDMKDLSAELTDCLQNSGVQVIWMLKTVRQNGENPEQLSVVDVLKYITSQALRLPDTKPTEGAMALTCARIKTAKTEDEWLSILGFVLAGLQKVYLVLDIETLNYDNSSVGADFWPGAFTKLFRELKERGSKTLVKVVLISYGSAAPLTDSIGSQSENYVSSVRAPVRGALQANNTRPARRSRGRLSGSASRGGAGRWAQRLEVRL
jgi:hypothetical protein